MMLVEVIKREAALQFGLTRKDMEGPCRARRASRPRQVAMALCRYYTRYSMPQIGRRFGGRDHTTVLHATRAITRLVMDPAFAVQVSTICARIDQLVASRAISRANKQAAPRPVLLLAPPPPAQPQPKIQQPKAPKAQAPKMPKPKPPSQDPIAFAVPPRWQHQKRIAGGLRADERAVLT